MPSTNDVQFEGEIKPGTNVVYVISKANAINGSQAGLKLEAQIQALREKDCHVSVLIADSLQRYNSKNPESKEAEAEALAWGDSFINDNQTYLQDCAILRWNDFIVNRKDEVDKMRARIDKEIEKNLSFKHAMDLTFISTNSSKGLSDEKLKKAEENSFNYQKEEYAVILSMSKLFEVMVYTRLTTAMSFMLAPTRFNDIQDRPRLIIVTPPVPSTPRGRLFSQNLKRQKPRISKQHCEDLSSLNKMFTNQSISQLDKNLAMVELANLVTISTDDVKKTDQTAVLVSQMRDLTIDTTKRSPLSREVVGRFTSTLTNLKIKNNKEASIELEFILDSILALLDIRLNGFEALKKVSEEPSLTLAAESSIAGDERPTIESSGSATIDESAELVSVAPSMGFRR